jgi:type I restriction enzyme S subunit
MIKYNSHKILGLIPENWTIKKFDDVVELIHGYQFRTTDFTKSGVKVFKITQIKGDGTIDISNCDFILKERLDNFNKNIIKYDSILMALTGATIGKIARFKSKEICLQNYRVGKFITKSKSELSEDYLYYFLSSNLFFHQLLARQTQSAQQNIGKEDINNMTICFPDLPSQTTIAEILSSLDDKIELNNKINQQLETLAQTLFKQWFIDFEFPNENGEPYKSSGGEMVDSELGEIPKGWEVGYLEDVIEFHNGYAFTSKELESENSTESYHVFKMGHIRKGGGLNAEGTKSYFSKSKAQKLSKYVLKKGDLLMCMTDMKGNVALLGHTALMNEDDKYIVNQRVGLLRPKNDVGIDYPYLYILTNSFDFIEELRSRANSGVQVNLSTNEIKKSKILIAPKSINEQFDLITKSFYDKIFEITNENETLRNTRDFLLPKLISGELVINEINN